MTPHRKPGTQRPALIDYQAPTPEIDNPARRALLESILEGFREWDGTKAANPAGDSSQQDIRAVMEMAGADHPVSVRDRRDAA